MSNLEKDIYGAFESIKAADSLKQETLRMLKQQTQSQASDNPQARSAKSNASGKRRKHLRSRRVWGLVAACLCIALVGTGSGIVYSTGTAYASIEINPSIELEINRFNYVIGATAENAEGQALLDQTKVINMPYEDAVDVLLANATSYISEESLISVTVCARTETQEEALLNVSTSQLAQENCTTECTPVSLETREEAAANDMPTGKYQAYLQLQALGASVTLDECRNMTLRELKSLITSNGGDASNASGNGSGGGSGNMSGSGSSMSGTGNGSGASGTESGSGNGAQGSGNGSGNGNGTGGGNQA